MGISTATVTVPDSQIGRREGSVMDTGIQQVHHPIYRPDHLPVAIHMSRQHRLHWRHREMEVRELDRLPDLVMVMATDLLLALEEAGDRLGRWTRARIWGQSRHRTVYRIRPLSLSVAFHLLRFDDFS